MAYLKKFQTVMTLFREKMNGDLSRHKGLHLSAAHIGDHTVKRV